MSVVMRCVTWLNCPHTIPVITIGFRENDYAVVEGAPPTDQYPKIRLFKNKEIVQPLQVQVIPLTASQFKNMNIPLPDCTSLPNPAQCKP